MENSDRKPVISFHRIPQYLKITIIFRRSTNVSWILKKATISILTVCAIPVYIWNKIQKRRVNYKEPFPDMEKKGKEQKTISPIELITKERGKRKL